MYVNTNLQNVAYAVIIVLGVGWLLYIGASILLPLTFAALFAIFLFPVDKWILSKVKFRALSITLSFLTVLMPLALVTALFSMQLFSIMDSLPSIGDNLKQGIVKAIERVDALIPFLDIDGKKLLSTNVSSFLDGPLAVLQQGVVTSSSFVVSLMMTFIYTFLFLYYRRSLRNFIVFQFEKRFRQDIIKTLSRIRVMVQSYVGGLGIVMVFLAVVNSIGLAIIGVPYPIFWGALGGLLAVIPYIGTALGGMLPFLYSMATSDSAWQPIAVIIFYVIIQTLEGNLITPKVVGDKVNINPLFAIIALIFFGNFWGIGGVILALPLISIIRITFLQFDSTIPLAILMSSNVADSAHKFKIWAEEN